MGQSRRYKPLVKPRRVLHSILSGTVSSGKEFRCKVFSSGKTRDGADSLNVFIDTEWIGCSARDVTSRDKKEAETAILENFSGFSGKSVEIRAADRDANSEAFIDAHLSGLNVAGFGGKVN